VEEHSDGNDDNDHDEDNNIETEEEDDEEEKSEKIHSAKDAAPETAAKKCVPRNRPIPEDYVCSACQNRHMPRHWIYDCPDTICYQTRLCSILLFNSKERRYKAPVKIQCTPMAAKLFREAFYLRKQ